MLFVKRLLGEQRKRAVASIMSAIESRTKNLSERERQDLRNVVMGAINQYHDTCLDVLKSSVSDGLEINEHALQVIADFNEALRAGLND